MSSCRTFALTLFVRTVADAHLHGTRLSNKAASCASLRAFGRAQTAASFSLRSHGAFKSPCSSRYGPRLFGSIHLENNHTRPRACEGSHNAAPARKYVTTSSSSPAAAATQPSRDKASAGPIGRNGAPVEQAPTHSPAKKKRKPRTPGARNDPARRGLGAQSSNAHKNGIGPASAARVAPSQARPRPERKLQAVAEKAELAPKKPVPRDNDLNDEDAREQKVQEHWRSQRQALKEKFPEGWQPRKRLSPDALSGIRALHKQFPNQYTTPVLAQKFEVSPEAIRRILKSKWDPNEEEEIERQERWFRRGKAVWSRYAEMGLKPPKMWRAEGIVRDPAWHDPEKRKMMKKKRLQEFLG